MTSLLVNVDLALYALRFGVGLYALGFFGLICYAALDLKPWPSLRLMLLTLFVNLAGGLFVVNAM